MTDAFSCDKDLHRDNFNQWQRPGKTPSLTTLMVTLSCLIIDFYLEMS